MKQKGLVWIGTSNTTLPGNKSTFPPGFQDKSRLHYYATIFNTVEINSCFYKTPQLSTYEKWALDVPDDFRFTLKLSKLITHSKEILVDLACMENFLQTAYGTGEKKGCLLIQFPGKLTLDEFEKVERILYQLKECDPLNLWRKAVEFRNPTWYTGEALEMLDEFGASMVLHDHPKAKNSDLVSRADFIYLRYHGPKGNYRESYTPEFLRSQAAFINEMKDKDKEVFVYFNNTIGNAFENALDLKVLLAGL
ncbi:MAG: DUF72 domain-containing protein [Ferruginibacter sp.]